MTKKKISKLYSKKADEINLDSYQFSKLNEEHPQEKESVEEFKEEDIQSLASVGMYLEPNANRSGTYVLCNHDALTVAKKIKGLECLPIATALQKYKWLREKYWFKAVKEDTDKYTAAVGLTIPRGYFIHVKKGAVIEEPFQAVLYINVDNYAMGIHNIIIVEDDAEIHIITGCTNAQHVHKGVHLGVSECYVGKNAKLTSTMIHNWGSELEVRPRSATVVEKNGRFISNYISVKLPKHVQMDPFTYLKGDNSNAIYNSILMGFPGTRCDIGGTVLLEGANTSAEIAARAVCYGGDIIQTGILIGAGKNCRAHVDCAGMMMCEEGMIEAIPGLRAMHPEARMSHEASIGRINTGEVAYLQSRGLTEQEAISMIIRGFLDIKIEGLGPNLDRMVKEIIEISGHGEE